MTNEEFSNNLDVLLNSYSTAAALGDEASKADIAFDEYEKSVFLTMSQEKLVLSLYNGKNTYGDTFEATEELRRYLSNLVVDITLEVPKTSEGEEIPFKPHSTGLNSKSKFFQLPSNLWFITYESVATGGEGCDAHSALDVYPTTQDEYHKIKKNPFRGASDRRALRLDLDDNIVEIISKFNVTSYHIRYIKKPKPIILVDLPDGLTINNESGHQECELHEALHQRILEGALALAIQSRSSKSATTTKE